MYYMNIMNYNTYELLNNDDKQTYRVGPKLFADFTALATNRTKTIRKLMIQYIHNEIHGIIETPKTDDFYNFFQTYEEEKRTKLLVIKLPKQLLEAFKIATPKQSQTLRLLMIEYIYNRRNMLND